jgi:hypothetical protein
LALAIWWFVYRRNKEPERKAQGDYGHHRHKSVGEAASLTVASGSKAGAAGGGGGGGKKKGKYTEMSSGGGAGAAAAGAVGAVGGVEGSRSAMAGINSGAMGRRASQLLVARVLHSFAPRTLDELELKAGSFVSLLESSPDKDWWVGVAGDKTGAFPANHVLLLNGSIDKKKKATAAFAFAGKTDAGELSFAAGDVVTLLDWTSDGDWWTGEDRAGRRGIFPKSYVVSNDGTMSGAQAAAVIAASQQASGVNAGAAAAAAAASFVSAAAEAKAGGGAEGKEGGGAAGMPTPSAPPPGENGEKPRKNSVFDRTSPLARLSTASLQCATGLY